MPKAPSGKDPRQKLSPLMPGQKELPPKRGKVWHLQQKQMNMDVSERQVPAKSTGRTGVGNPLLRYDVGQDSFHVEKSSQNPYDKDFVGGYVEADRLNRGSKQDKYDARYSVVNKAPGMLKPTKLQDRMDPQGSKYPIRRVKGSK